jgi:hypothetical protein
MPTIRIDDEVYAWLQSLAKPFEDNPNSVLRRVAGLESGNDPSGQKGSSEANPAQAEARTVITQRRERLSGRLLNQRWKVGALHALYHQDGTFYENLTRFPGALFDPNGYVVFSSEKNYEKCAHLSIGEKLNVRGGIASIPGYVRMQ